jgi:Holliday junction resolvasome RuvABC DNA-binding subunit
MVVMKTAATQALTQAGYPKSEARQMVEAAASSAPPDLNLERLVRAAVGVARTRYKR